MATAPKKIGQREKRKRLPEKRQRRDRAYDHTWRKFATQFARAYPLCVLCIWRGRLGDDARTQGSRRNVVVDHIEPFATAIDPLEAMYQPDNLQPLCARCHDRDKQRIERRSQAGKVRAEWLRYLKGELDQHRAHRHCAELRQFLPAGIQPIVSQLAN